MHGFILDGVSPTKEERFRFTDTNSHVTVSPSVKINKN